MQQEIFIPYTGNWQAEEYFESLKEYQGNMLLVGINYNIRTKDHECVIEELKKDK